VISIRRLLSVLSTLLVCGCALAPAIAAADGVPLGEAPPLPEGTAPLGAVAPGRELTLQVALEPRDPAALEEFANQVSTPGSPLYGQFLSVGEFAERFGASPAQVATVSTALRARGLAVGAPAANSLSLPIEASAAEAEAAFGIDLERVRTSDGRIAFANTGAPEVPAAAAPYVAGVLGLSNLALPSAEAARPEAEAASPSGAAEPQTPLLNSAPLLGGGPQPCKEAIEAQVSSGWGYTSNQVASVYDLDGFYAAGNYGAGQTVALFELEPYLPSDIAQFQACYGTHAAIETVNVNGGPGPYKEKDGGEAELDIEQVIGLAPEADLIVYQASNQGSASTQEILTTWVTENRAKVMSSSWGLCEPETARAEMVAVHTILQEAAAQGQSYFVAAGDEGATDCFVPKKNENKVVSVDYPGSDPFAIDVGGTRIEEPTNPPVQYIWSDGPEGGAGGGGVSARFKMPAYQEGADHSLNVVNEWSSRTPCGMPSGYCREVPDVSADADPETAYLFFDEKHWQAIGGTSAAAPVWAAFAALTNASPTCGGKTIGFANPALYALGGTAYADNFYDVTDSRPGGPESNNMFSTAKEELPFYPETHYDMTTGIGTPIGTSLAASLCTLANPAVPTPPAPPAPPATPTDPASTPATTDPAKADDASIKPAAPAPTPTRLLNSRVAGIGKGAPRLDLGVEARQGGRLETVTIGLPAGLTAGTKKELTAGVIASAGGAPLAVAVRTVGRAIQVRLLTPATAVALRIGGPALSVDPRLRGRVQARDAKRLHLVVTARESGGAQSRFPMNLPL
jgi:hypothetical protein